MNLDQAPTYREPFTAFSDGLASVVGELEAEFASHPIMAATLPPADEARLKRLRSLAALCRENDCHCLRAVEIFDRLESCGYRDGRGNCIRDLPAWLRAVNQHIADNGFPPRRGPPKPSTSEGDAA